MNKIIAFINIIFKIRYNKKYTALYLKKESYIYLKLYYRYKVFKLENRKLNQ